MRAGNDNAWLYPSAAPACLVSCATRGCQELPCGEGPCVFSPRGMACFLPDWGKRWQACCILTGRPSQQGIMLIMAPPRHSQLIMSLSPSRSLVMLISPWHSSTFLICMPFLSLPSLFAVSLFFSVSIRVFSRPFSPKKLFSCCFSLCLFVAAPLV